MIRIVLLTTTLPWSTTPGSLAPRSTRLACNYHAHRSSYTDQGFYSSFNRLRDQVFGLIDEILAVNWHGVLRCPSLLTSTPAHTARM